VTVIIIDIILYCARVHVQRRAGQASTLPESKVGAWNVLAVHTSLRLVKITASSVRPAQRLTSSLLLAPPTARVTFIS